MTISRKNTIGFSPKPIKAKSGLRARQAWLVVLTLLMSLLAFPTVASAADGVGCEPDSIWDSPSNPECVLEYPAETRVLMGIRFGYYIANCPTSFGSGKDGPEYIKFSGVKPDGILEIGKTYEVEAWFGHDCRDFAGAYDLDVFLVSESGEKSQLVYKSESYYSYRSKRVSLVGQDYCLMYSCGNTTFKFELKVPRAMTLGSASLEVRARTDPTKDVYRFGSVDSTFNYPNVFTIKASSTPEPTLLPSPTPTPSQSNLTDGKPETSSNVTVFKNCSTLWKNYPGGVMTKKGIKNKGGKTSKKPFVSESVYKFNKKLDKDKDGIVCER